MHPPRPILILGPTAGGKSTLAVVLAERLGADGAAVLGADSMQIYREMDAGTAKPTPDQRRRAAHHLIDIVDPTDRFTVADWLQRADALLAELMGQGIVPIVVGGTNLYIKALLEGLFDGPPMDPDVRAALSELPAPALHARLQQVDPVAAERIHANDHRRLVRALEVFDATGRPISTWQTQWQDEQVRDASATGPGPISTAYRHDPIIIGLEWPAASLSRRINLRVKAMFHPADVEPELAAQVVPAGESLPDEALRLAAAGRLGRQAGQALGYRQVLACQAGGQPMAVAFEQTKIRTRRFARMQRTWLRRFRGVHWLPAEGLPEEALAASALAAIGSRGRRPAPG